MNNFIVEIEKDLSKLICKICGKKLDDHGVDDSGIKIGKLYFCLECLVKLENNIIGEIKDEI